MITASKENVLLLVPYASRWLPELITCLSTNFNVFHATFGPNPGSYDAKKWASHTSQQITNAIRIHSIDRLYINYEFAWQLLLESPIKLDLDASKIFCLLFDDCVFHSENLEVAKLLEISRFIHADPIANLKYQELGYDSFYVPLEGSRQRFRRTETEYLYTLSFYGNVLKADRSAQLEAIKALYPLTIAAEEGVGASSYEELSLFINRSKLNLNLSKSRPDRNGVIRNQFKGRILEVAFCGGLPITENCPGTSLLFGDAIPQFNSILELPDIIELLLASESDLEERRQWVSSISDGYRPEYLHSMVH